MAYLSSIVKQRAFADRREAGRELAARLPAYLSRRHVVVLALPRGGAPARAESEATDD